MIYTGFYIILALFVINKLSTFSKINLGIIMGLMIPDLDIFFKYLNSNNSFHGGIFHSIFFSTLVFIILLIISEFNRKIIDRKIINGLFIGTLIHIFLDILLVGGEILFYWPLPIGAVDSLFRINLSYEMLYILSCLQFLLLRYYGHQMNSMIIKTKFLNGNSCKSINTISQFMKYQFILFSLFLIMFVFNLQFSKTLIDFSIFSSLIVALYFSYNIKDIFNKDIKIG
tara:strand:- start:1383 stop:2066 length:684 start_codon:yes stop_codon:yes gene_type:complete